MLLPSLSSRARCNSPEPTLYVLMRPWVLITRCQGMSLSSGRRPLRANPTCRAWAGNPTHKATCPYVITRPGESAGSVPGRAHGTRREVRSFLTEFTSQLMMSIEPQTGLKPQDKCRPTSARLESRPGNSRCRREAVFVFRYSTSPTLRPAPYVWQNPTSCKRRRGRGGSTGPSLCPRGGLRASPVAR